MEQEDRVPKTNRLTEFKTRFKELKKTPFLIVGLVIITGILLAISLNFRQPNKPQTKISKPVDFAHTSLAISDETRTSSISGVFELDINIDSGDNNITGAQIELEYDPEALTQLDLVGGEFLDDPQVIIKNIDEELGRATLVIGIKPGQKSVKGSGTIAIISFRKLVDGPTYINFLPQTLISAAGFDQSVLKETISAVIETPQENKTP